MNIENVEVEKVEEGFAVVKNIFRADKNEEYQEGFNDLHLMVLVYMQKFTVFHTNKIDFTLGWLYDDLNIKNSTTRERIVAAFLELVDMELIELDREIEGKIDRNTRLSIKQIFYDDESTFTKIYHSEFDKIMNLDIDIRTRRGMLFIFTLIVSRIDSKGFSFPSYENIRKALGVANSSNKTSRALKLLVDNGLIIYDSSAMIHDDNGNVVPAYSIYTRCIYKDHMKYLQSGIDYRKRDYEKDNKKVFNSKQGNLKRSINPSMKPLWQKVIDKSISATELEKLNELENKYYNLIKSDAQKLIEFKDNFMTIEIDEKLELVNTRIKTELEKEIEEVLKLF